MQGDDEIVVQAYAKLLHAKVPGKVARSLVVMDVDKEVGFLNFLEYLMYKIENDMDIDPERWPEATKHMKMKEHGYIRLLLNDASLIALQANPGPLSGMTKPQLLSEAVRVGLKVHQSWSDQELRARIMEHVDATFF
ncbi:unnamed protein product [Symbiodinium sp. CCMP2592]|nr:unnamed protein product [Symbiodinium sp. CCMP2592]